MREPPKSGWNWWAFLFSTLWYLYHGLWAKGFGLLLANAMIGGFFAAALGSQDFGWLGSLVVAIYAGAKANEDYYIRWLQRQRSLGNR